MIPVSKRVRPPKLPSQWVEFDAQRKRITDAGLRQLDQQYRSWFAQQVAATDQDGDLQRADGVETLTDTQFRQLYALGLGLYGKVGWDEKRPQLVAAASSKQLTPDQAKLLIDGHGKRLQERNRMRIAA